MRVSEIKKKSIFMLSYNNIRKTCLNMHILKNGYKDNVGLLNLFFISSLYTRYFLVPIDKIEKYESNIFDETV